MTETQFNSIETYLEHFKDEISRINIDNINETTNAIWDKLDSQNKILEEIVGLIKDLIEK